MDIDEYLARRREEYHYTAEITAYKARVDYVYDWKMHRRNLVILLDIGRQQEIGRSPEIEIPPELQGHTEYKQIGPHPNTQRMMQDIRIALRRQNGLSAQELARAIGKKRKTMVALIGRWMKDEVRAVTTKVQADSGRGVRGTRYYLIANDDST